MSNEVLTYILIAFFALFLISMSIYFLPSIKKTVKKVSKNKKKKKKKNNTPKAEKPKRPILLSPQESKKSEKPLGVEYGGGSEKKESPKTNDDLVMDFPPLVTAPKTSYGNRTVINSNKNVGNEFDEIKNFLRENEEDLFTSVGRNALNNRATTQNSAPPTTPRTSTIYNTDNSFKQQYPEFVASKTPSFSYSKPKEYAPGKSVFDLQQDEKDIIRQFKNLSPEMKKMLVLDVLSKKKSDDV
jgi:hypothetical protein